MGQGPTHLQIAQVLGIAKGTVDSSVFKVREELRCTEYRERLARLFDAT
jgi:DNA-directed RNA polymerase specialized sigma24 family protein